MNNNRKYFSLEKSNQTASINIYGDITSYPWAEGDTSSASLSKVLDSLSDVSQINVYINSYGGEVAEGLAIYNALKRHKAQITTFCDGFACSIASVIFMAGDKRVMNESSLLMIHNAWTYASGNAAELRKQANDLEKITQASIEAYKSHSSLSEEDIKALMDAESWLLPSEALAYGFATEIEQTTKEKASQNAFSKLMEIVKAYQAEEHPEDDTEDEEPTDDTETEDEPEKDDDVSEEATDDEQDETPEDNETDADTESDEETDGEDKEEEAAQRWNGFFNSLLKL